MTAAGIGADQLLETEPHLREARERAHLLAATAIAERAPGARNCYDPVADKIVFWAINYGDVAIDANNVTFLVDGVFMDGWVAEVSGAVSNNWRPGEQAYFNRSGVTTEQSRVTAQTADGNLVFSEKVLCPSLATIVVTPSSASMQIGDTQDFTATGYDQFGDLFDGRPYTWSSAGGTTSSLTTSSGRLVAGTVSGTYTMVATSGAVSGNASIVIHPGVPASVTVSPGTVDVAAGGTQAFTATVYDQYGNVNGTSPVTWSTNAGSISVGGTLTAQTTAQSGRSVTATTTGGVFGTASVNVVPDALHHITVTPSSATLLTSAAQSFTAVAYDQYNNVRSDTLTWAASRGSVTQGGAYTAPTTAGAATVYANASGISGSAALTIQANVNVLSMQTYKNGVATTSFLRDDTVEVRVTVRDQAGNLVPNALVNVEFTYPPTSTLACNCTGTTDGSGIASITYLLPGNAKRDTWTITTTLVSGSNLIYVPGSNAQTSTTFVVN